MTKEMDNVKEAIYRIGGRTLGISEPFLLRSIHEVSSGEAHYNYIVDISGKKFIVRLSAVRKDDKGGNSWAVSHIEREYNGIKSIERLHIAPKIYYKDTSCRIVDRPFLVIDYLEGSILKRVSDKDLKNLAKILANLHDIHKMKGIRRESVKDYNRGHMKDRVDKISNSGFSYHVNSKFRISLVKAFEKVNKIKLKKTKLSLIHGDVGPKNVLRTEEGLRLIDWEHVRLSEPQFEIATVLDRFHLSGVRRRLFLEEYHSYGGAKLIRLHDYEEIRNFDRLLWSISEFIKTQHNIGNKTVYKRRNPKKYVESAHYEFMRCKELGLFDNKDRLILRT